MRQRHRPGVVDVDEIDGRAEQPGAIDSQKIRRAVNDVTAIGLDPPGLLIKRAGRTGKETYACGNRRFRANLQRTLPGKRAFERDDIKTGLGRGARESVVGLPFSWERRPAQSGSARNYPDPWNIRDVRG